MMQTNLGNLTKSKNQAAFIDKYLKTHLEFIRTTKMPQSGQSIMKDIDDKLSFKDLLTIQMAPRDVHNARKVRVFCQQILQSQLSITRRLKDGMMKTGT